MRWRSRHASSDKTSGTCVFATAVGAAFVLASDPLSDLVVGPLPVDKPAFEVLGLLLKFGAAEKGK